MNQEQQLIIALKARLFDQGEQIRSLEQYLNSLVQRTGSTSAKEFEEKLSEAFSDKEGQPETEQPQE